MEKLLLREVILATSGMAVIRDDSIEINRVVIDSRKVNPGDLFFAIEGENLDGHDYVISAIEKGAFAVVASRAKQKDDFKNLPMIYVEDTTKALGLLSHYYLKKLKKPVVAVTGSVGKTSTKEMIFAALSAELNVHKTKGNFNNEWGLPLTLFEATSAHDVIVLEMGMCGLGEIKYLTEIAPPDVAVITNIGISHIERLGSQENILKAKWEIIEGMKADGRAIINHDDPFLRNAALHMKDNCIRVGLGKENDFYAHEVESLGEDGVRFTLKHLDEAYPVKLSAMGSHQVTNSLIALACADLFKIPLEKAILKLKSTETVDYRMKLIVKKGVKYLDDAYNASTDSMCASLNVLKEVAKEGRAIALLGNMLELGALASQEHEKVGKCCASLNLDFVGVIGENAQDLVRGLKEKQAYQIFKSHEEMVTFLRGYLKASDVVLVKGSRSMAMEKVIQLMGE